VAAKKGLFEAAEGGSLFFDEISNIDPNVQVKLLRVLQEREYMQLGGTETLRADVRIIAATNTDLSTLVESGVFREDLYYRINVIRILLPPLRDRREDIPLLVDHFLKTYASENHKQLKGVTPQAMRWLERRDWPGNVRELENAVQRAVVLARSDCVDLDLLADDDLAPRPRPVAGSHLLRGSYKESLEAFERELILDALNRASGVQKRAAGLLGLKPTTLSEKIKRLGLRRDEPRA
jgi:two-component system response regulator PilR (NtrC family)